MEEGTGLKLDTKSVKNRTEAGASLTDENQIAVFTDEFEQKKQDSEKAQQTEQSKLAERIFLGQAMENPDNLSETLFLTVQPGRLSKGRENGPMEKSGYGIGIFPLVFVIIMLGFRMSRRKKKGM